MLGTYVIKLKSAKCGYVITLRRSITVLQGNSGCGKTLFCTLLEQYLTEMEETGDSSTVQLSISPAVQCYVLTRKEWNRQGIYGNIEDLLHNRIIFIDETCSTIMRSRRFTNFVNRGDNYFVLITRDLSALESLAISVNEIYTLTDKNNYNIPKARFIVNTNTPLWCNTAMILSASARKGLFKSDFVLTEDGKSGYKFFN